MFATRLLAAIAVKLMMILMVTLLLLLDALSCRLLIMVTESGRGGGVLGSALQRETFERRKQPLVVVGLVQNLERAQQPDTTTHTWRRIIAAKLVSTAVLAAHHFIMMRMMLMEVAIMIIAVTVIGGCEEFVLAG